MKGKGPIGPAKKPRVAGNTAANQSLRLTIEHLSGLALLQDRGRHHLVPAGVPRSGPIDPVAHLTALRLVGNPPMTPTIEYVGRFGFRLEAGSGTAFDCALMAACGDVQICINGVPRPAWTALECPVGEVVEVMSRSGFGYLSLAGGPRARQVLGASATCLLGSLGPDPLRTAQHLEYGVPGPWARAWVGSFARPPQSQGPLRVVPGPHGRPPSSRVVVVAVDRIGVRCSPRKPRRAGASAKLPSLGVLPGAIQMLPSGDLVILGPDAGTMGGYPVVGVLASCDVWRMGRVTVGEELELLEVAPDPARRAPRPMIFRPIS